MRRFLRSAGAALSGIACAYRTQHHIRFHCFSAAVVIIAGLALRLSRFEWAWLVIAIVSVLAAELINTAVENVVDLASPNIHPLAKAAKDTAAGAVLVAAAGAVVIGLLVFGPHLWALVAQKG
ncbi:diacylglycerol kinase family protein [Paenibacillus humicola]|uniref:diacylglycerol kinase family protein n=1 Tax=Paenibacillus humicola TaxID=3110540 RepID=UPI00237C0D5E|nr:diacylglycerol kinase family protein [Paenibacillus humicola]